MEPAADQPPRRVAVGPGVLGTQSAPETGGWHSLLGHSLLGTRSCGPDSSSGATRELQVKQSACGPSAQMHSRTAEIQATAFGTLFAVSWHQETSGIHGSRLSRPWVAPDCPGESKGKDK